MPGILIPPDLLLLRLHAFFLTACIDRTGTDIMPRIVRYQKKKCLTGQISYDEKKIPRILVFLYFFELYGRNAIQQHFLYSVIPRGKPEYENPAQSVNFLFLLKIIMVPASYSVHIFGEPKHHDQCHMETMLYGHQGSQGR